MPILKNMKLSLYLIPCIKTNPRGIKDIKVKKQDFKKPFKVTSSVSLIWYTSISINISVTIYFWVFHVHVLGLFISTWIAVSYSRIKGKSKFITKKQEFFHFGICFLQCINHLNIESHEVVHLLFYKVDNLIIMKFN